MPVAIRAWCVIAAFALSAAAGVITAAQAPAGSSGDGGRLIGWDTYRRLDLLPYLRSDTEALQFSSFDRSGGDFDLSTGNRNGTGGCLADGGAGCVIAEDRGAGEVDSIWFTRDGGKVTRIGNVRVELDGQAVLDAPLQSVVDGALGAPFAWPLVANAAQSPGGVYIKVPMPYRRSMRISVTSNLEYYHVDYRRFSTAEGVTTFSPADPALDVVATLRDAGTADPKPPASSAAHDKRIVELPAGAGVTIAESTGSGSISALHLRLREPADQLLSGLRLQMEFDGQTTVDSPLGEFFGAGLGVDTVRSLMFAAIPQPDGSLSLSGWWPMPFAHEVRLTLVNTTDDAVAGIDSDVTIAPDARWAPALAGGRAGYFTARSHAAPTTLGQDWLFADEHGHGKFVGVSHTIRGSRIRTAFSDAAPYFLEEPSACTPTVPRRPSGMAPAPRTSTRVVGISRTAPASATRSPGSPIGARRPAAARTTASRSIGSCWPTPSTTTPRSSSVSSTGSGTWSNPITAQPLSSTHSRMKRSRPVTKSAPAIPSADSCTATATPTPRTSCWSANTRAPTIFIRSSVRSAPPTPP